MAERKTKMNQPVVLIDMMNLIFRSHFVFRNLSSNGRPTGALYGCLRTIAELREHVSKRLLFVWDHGIPVSGAAKPRNWRDEFLKGYKGTRKHEGNDRELALSQSLDIAQAISLLGYESTSIVGLEADDLIGILSRNLPDDEILIFSNDHDFYQLLSNSSVKILIPKKDQGSFRYLTRSDIEEEYKISVKRWAEYLALGGDKSDNIKPKPGMGPKTAIKLIQQGVDLNQHLNCQPAFFQEKYGEVWPAIQNMYAAARIPTSWGDQRIVDCTHGLPLLCSPDQQWPNQKIKLQSQNVFMRFCADRDLVSILSLRRSLFEAGEQKWPKDESNKNNRKSLLTST